ncbi:hypothetical protein HPG69_008871, partial [Diceros bicornis minor]
MRVMGPRTFFLLLSGVLTLTETWAGECGVGRKRPLQGAARGDRAAGTQDPRGWRVSADTCPEPQLQPWHRPTRRVNGHAQTFRASLDNVRGYYNQSEADPPKGHVTHHPNSGSSDSTQGSDVSLRDPK